MEIDCFLYPGWKPRIRAAAPRRDWMDDTPESFAYRCLPLGIANAHGWEIATSVGFAARWSGGIGVDAVEIIPDDPTLKPTDGPVSLFGQAVLTFHIAGLFRTSPGWNLWLSGPPNTCKDAIAPLSAIIETDWSPYSFTMNWRFTRPNEWVRFEPDEAIAFFFPVERATIEKIVPRVRMIDDEPDLKSQFEDWSRARDSFHVLMREAPPDRPSEKWQKLYYRGVCPSGEQGVSDHQSKLRVHAFAGLKIDTLATTYPISVPASSNRAADTELARRDWILSVQEDLRALVPRTAQLRRVQQLEPQRFLEEFYAANRPVILCGEMADWPAFTRWSPTYLSKRLGDVSLHVQSSQRGDRRMELEQAPRRQALPLSSLIDGVGIGTATHSVRTRDDSLTNKTAFAPLFAELGHLDRLLCYDKAAEPPMLSISSEDAFVRLDQGLTNHLLAQIVGRRRLILVPPSETSKLCQADPMLGDLTDPQMIIDHPVISTVRLYDVMLEPGEILFLPIGWWHQSTSVEFSVSATFINFNWPNHWSGSFPSDRRGRA